MIDLHAHTLKSDGTDSPTELVEKAHKQGLHTIAITDHDSTAGWDEAAKAAVARGVGLVRGIELSTHHPGGFEVHMLCYLPDANNAALQQVLADTVASRHNRGQRLVEQVNVDYAITWAEVVAVTPPGATVGKPHVADALVAAGHFANRQEAFAKVLYSGSPYNARYVAPATSDAVQLILAAGGVPVVAHPLDMRRRRCLTIAEIGELIEVGLAGIEVDHRDNPGDMLGELRTLARQHDLIITGSSDYHGAGKVNTLAENTTDASMLARVVEQGTAEYIAG